MERFKCLSSLFRPKVRWTLPRHRDRYVPDSCRYQLSTEQGEVLQNVLLIPGSNASDEFQLVKGSERIVPSPGPRRPCCRVGGPWSWAPRSGRRGNPDSGTASESDPPDSPPPLSAQKRFLHHRYSTVSVQSSSVLNLELSVCHLQYSSDIASRIGRETRRALARRQYHSCRVRQRQM